MQNQRRIMVIEDNPDIAQMLALNLRNEGFAVFGSPFDQSGTHDPGLNGTFSRDSTRPHASAVRYGTFVPDPFSSQLRLELSKWQKHVQGHPAHGCGSV